MGPLPVPWPGVHRARHEKLLDMAQEIAGPDRSQSEKLTALERVL